MALAAVVIAGTLLLRFRTWSHNHPRSHVFLLPARYWAFSSDTVYTIDDTNPSRKIPTDHLTRIGFIGVQTPID